MDLWKKEIRSLLWGANGGPISTPSFCLLNIPLNIKTVSFLVRLSIASTSLPLPLSLQYRCPHPRPRPCPGGTLFPVNKWLLFDTFKNVPSCRNNLQLHCGEKLNTECNNGVLTEDRKDHNINNNLNVIHMITTLMTIRQLK